MRTWHSLYRIARYAKPSSHRLASRPFSTLTSHYHNVERVSVPVGSSGDVSIDLHNIDKVASPNPLLIYLPPYSTAFTDQILQLPSFCRALPTAVINYRWAGLGPFQDQYGSYTDGKDDEEENRYKLMRWPAPIHDTLKAYSWIIEHLAPPMYTRRDVYVYGSYLGASLATSLALTEAHPHERMAVRGCLAHNGVYNWTMFLPDHPVHHMPKGGMNFLDVILAGSGEPDFQVLKQRAEALFRTPENLFDPFASSCLLFHTPGLLVPPSFDASAIPTISTRIASADPSPSPDAPVDTTENFIETMIGYKAPRKSPLVFPPRKSTLKIPEMLLMHTRPPSLPPSYHRRRQRRKKENLGNNFKNQADELAGLMRRSINRVELKDRLKWDDDHDGWELEASRRVQVQDIGHDHHIEDVELGEQGNELAASWLREQMLG
ncbi:hypothetical protein F4778DRAFT_544145 [Xylariomycetidae sp. FL2044]|nr:hypothetical protein F4778DRAFT_544145 [Xylariomycetidae sp. FL2044]